MKCEHAVILAAGKGSRLKDLCQEKPKCLIEIKDQPIIAWVLRSISLAGIKKVTIVTGYKRKILEQSIGDGKEFGLRIDYFYNTRWNKPNGISLYCVKDRIINEAKEGFFLTMMSDHLIHWEEIRRTAQAPTQNCVLAIEKNLQKVFDISDATKVRLEDGKPTAIGKRLRKYNAVDCGLFRFDKRIFEALEESISNGNLALTDGVRRLIEKKQLDVIAIGNHPWIDIDTPRTYRQALRIVEKLFS